MFSLCYLGSDAQRVVSVHDTRQEAEQALDCLLSELAEIRGVGGNYAVVKTDTIPEKYRR